MRLFARLGVVASLLLTGYAQSSAQLTDLSAPTGTMQFGSANIGASQTAYVLLQVTSPMTIAGITATVSQGGAQEFVVATATGCMVDGLTVNPSGTVCSVPVAFKPAYAGLRIGALKVATSLGTFSFGLVGTGVGPQVVGWPGTITTAAGTGTAGYVAAQDGGAAISANLSSPAAVAVDSAGNLYIADTANNRIRMVTAAGIISTIAGNGTATGEGIPALTAAVTQPTAIALDAAGDIYFTDSGSRVRMINAGSGTVVTVAGTGTAGSGVDGIAATSSQLNNPSGIVAGIDGTLYIADTGSNRVRRVDPYGRIETVAGTGTAGYNGDVISAVTAQLSGPVGLAMDVSGNLLIADAGNNRVRKVNFSTAVITTVAGSASSGFSGDGGAAVAAELSNPTGITLDGAGDIYIADKNNDRIRKVDAANGTIYTVAGSSSSGFGGDGATATSAQLNAPNDVAIDSLGDLLIADTANNRIRTDGNTAAPLNFADTYISFTSTDSPQTVYVANIGTTSSLTFPLPSGSAQNPSVSTNWSLGNSGTCPVLTSTSTTNNQLSAGGDCSLVVSFTPTADGPLSGTITLTDNALNATSATQTISLTGTGLSKPTPYIAPTSIDFGTQPSGTTSNFWTVTLNNTSGVSLELNSITLSDPINFKQTNNCPSVLPAYTNCNIQVSFSPSSAATFNGFLVFTDDGINSPQSVSLTGVGTSSAATATLAPTSIQFSDQPVGVTSNSWTVTLNNTSGTAMTITSISIDNAAEFSQTNSCGTSLAAHATCTILVSFTPSATGPQTGILTVLDSATGGSQTATLSGNGISSGPSSFLSPSSIAFGNQQQGTTSNAWTVTLNNTSGTPLTIGSIVTANPFAQTNSCGTTLAAHSTCNIVVTFSPTALGLASGLLRVFSNDATNPVQVVTLSGTGTSVGPSSFLSPTSIAFGNQSVGTTSNAWTVTLNNTSSTALAITTIAAAAPFLQTNSCGSSLAAYSTCNILVSFAPTGAGTFNGMLTVVSNDATSPTQFVSLTGVGTAAVPSSFLSPTNINFGTQSVGTTSNPWTVTFNNTSGTSLTISSIVAVGLGFSETNSCGATLAAHSTCNILVSFAPTSVSTFTGNLLVTSNDPVNPVQTVGLTGTGLSAGPTSQLAPTSINFGNQTVGTPSNPWTVTLSNTSATPLTLTSILASGAGFSETNTCGATLAAYSTCNILVTFTPASAQISTGSLVVISNDSVNPLQTVSLTGTGVANTPVVFFAPMTINFSNQAVGTTGNYWTVTLNNTGSIPVSYSGIVLSDPTDFVETNTCGTGLAAYTTCNIQVSFKPSTSGLISGLMTAVINGVTQTVTLSGTGTVAPDYSLTVNPSTLTLNAGQTGLATYTFTPVGGYSGTVFFSCTGLPAGANCIFTPPSVTANGSNAVQTAQLMVTTSGPYSGTVTLAKNSGGPSPMLAAFFLPGFVCGGLLLWRRRSIPIKVQRALFALTLCLTMMGALGCSAFTNFTPPGTSTVTVVSTATATTTGSASSGTTTHTASFTLTIKQ